MHARVFKAGLRPGRGRQVGGLRGKRQWFLSRRFWPECLAAILPFVSTIYGFASVSELCRTAVTQHSDSLLVPKAMFSLTATELTRATAHAS